MPQCSVIIPCFNERDYLPRCLASLAKQSLQDHEVIVVDDGSTDNSREIAQQHGVTVLKGQHRGPALARNLGVQHAASDIVVFVDADMEVHPLYLERLIAPILAGESPGTFHLDEFVANPESVWATCWTIHENLPPGRRLAPDHAATSPVFRAMLKSEFLKVGGYDDTGYGEDVTVSSKLGYPATGVRGAYCFHNNPATLAEVYQSARWIGRGNHTPRTWAYALRRTPLFSVARGWQAARRHRLPALLPFRVCFDAGLLAGLVSSLVTGKHVK